MKQQNAEFESMKAQLLTALQTNKLHESTIRGQESEISRLNVQLSRREEVCAYVMYYVYMLCVCVYMCTGYCVCAWVCYAPGCDVLVGMCCVHYACVTYPYTVLV